jgi:ubiquinone/menaquinone biosynthesis C-methylase UbiE
MLLQRCLYGEKRSSCFFDRLAPVWDEDNKYDEQKIEKILDYAGIRQGVSVLDIACGTDILFPFYLRRGVSKIAGVDLSEGMIALAKQKFSDPRIDPGFLRVISKIIHALCLQYAHQRLCKSSFDRHVVP